MRHFMLYLFYSLLAKAQPPRHEHDCSDCKYLGRHRDGDLYWCPQGGQPTVIFRYGPDGDYASGMLENHKDLSVAMRRAEILGLSLKV